MSQIGQFTRKETGFTGQIRTLTLDLSLALVPVENSETENAPAYRVHAGDADGPGGLLGIDPMQDRVLRQRLEQQFGYRDV